MKVILILLTLALPILIFAQSNQAFPTKYLDAERTKTQPKIDGKLTDSVWTFGKSASDFIINSPDFGKPAQVKTEVKLLYDNEALYIGATLYDDPTHVRKQLTARDGERQQDVDYFSVFLDTYNDDQNGFQFVVTSRNVQSDARISSTIQTRFGPPSDYSWDAVWESHVELTQNGWTLEMKIPYLSLRFANIAVQHWGINFQRFSRRLNESSYWNAIDPNQAGFVNQFGNLNGIQGIQPPLRLSFLPYVTTGYRSIPTNKETVREVLHNGGMDVKWGVNESFTLDATLIPDFGQVVSDNVILNLSPYEVRFQENRPFFTEGTELFNKAGLFYSRRIGMTPSGFWSVKNRVANDPNLSIQKNPGLTQLINASKFSGRNKKNLGIGVFNAISAPMYAVIENRNTGSTERIETEPITNYNLFVLDQALQGRSSITFTNTNVMRSGNARDANVSALDFTLYNKKISYAIQGTSRYSKITGVTPYDGYTTAVSFKKISGHIQGNLLQSIESDRYDPNDLGYLQAPNEVKTSLQVSYNQFVPSKRFLSYSYSFRFTNVNTYKPAAWSEINMGASAFHWFKNFWDLTVVYESKPVWQHDYFELRTPGRMIRMMPWHYLGFSGSTDSRKKLYSNVSIGMATTPAFKDASFFKYEIELRYRINNQLSIELAGEGSTDDGNVGYAYLNEPNGEPIIGWRNVVQHTTLLAGVYNFTPRMFLTLRTRHYWSKVTYEKYYNVDAKGYWVNRTFIPGNNENYNAYNLDLFYTWDFMYGSRLIVGWKNWMPMDMSIDGGRYPKYGQNLREIFSLQQGKELTCRLVYFLDHQKFKKKANR